MKYMSLIIGLISMITNPTIGVSLENIGSQLKGSEENLQISRRIFDKAGPLADVSVLESEEKEWLYETDLLETIKASESHGESEAADRSRDLSELARFYEFKARPDLVDQLLLQKAKLDLTSALKGDEAILGIFNSMLKNGRIKDNYFKKIIDLCCQDPDAFVRGSCEHLIKEDEFQDHILSLAEAYKGSIRQTLRNRTINNKPIPIYDEVLKQILLKRIKRRNSHQAG